MTQSVEHCDALASAEDAMGTKQLTSRAMHDHAPALAVSALGSGQEIGKRGPSHTVSYDAITRVRRFAISV